MYNTASYPASAFFRKKPPKIPIAMTMTTFFNCFQSTCFHCVTKTYTPARIPRQRDTKEKSSWKSMLLLIGAGIVHGMFVSGGPLLIGYLSNEIKEKTSFRATISTIWIILNSMILVQDICAGMWNAGLVMTQCISIPFLIAGMAAGSVLVKRMSQEIFMKLTYILLFISGILLMVK